MANPDDTLLSDDPAANLETPPPVPVEVSPTAERSGAISISGGDFATPMVRKRTITKPRGMPTVAAPVDFAADVVTPPPVQNGTPAAPATTPNATRQTHQRAASPVDPDATSLRGQASRLRATGLQPVPAPPPAEDIPLTPPPPAAPKTPAAAAPPKTPAAAPKTPAAALKTPAAAPKTPAAALRRDTGTVKVELPSVDIDPGPTPPPFVAPSPPVGTPAPARAETAIPEPVEEPRLEAPPVESDEAPEALAAPSFADEPPVLDLGSLVDAAIAEEPLVHEEPLALHEEPLALHEEPLTLHEEPLSLHE